MSPRSVQAFPKPTRADRLKADRAEREAATLARGQLRHEVLVRAGERCELCRADLHLTGMEMHHVVSGNGKRPEALGTLAALCLACHHAIHRSEDVALRRLADWAAVHGAPEARAEVRRRRAKIETRHQQLARVASETRRTA